MLYIDFKRYKGGFTNKKMNEQIKTYIKKILGISCSFTTGKVNWNCRLYYRALRYATCGA